MSLLINHALMSSPVLYEPEYQAILNYATAQGYTKPSIPVQKEQNLFIAALKTAGIWADLDIFYNFYTDGDLNFACINWKNPGTFQCTPVNSPTLVTLSGVQGNGTSSYLNTNWTPSINGSKFTLDECSIGGTVNSNVANSGVDIGCGNVAGTLHTYFISRSATDTFAARINAVTNISIVSQTQAIGFYHLQRTSSGNQKSFRAGVQTASQSATSVALPDSTLTIGAYNVAGSMSSFSPRIISLAWAGASLVGKELTFYNTWASYVYGANAANAYTAIINYATTQGYGLPSLAQQAEQQKLIKQLYAIGAWTQIDIFYNFTTDGSAEFARINWKNPSLYYCAVVGSAPALHTNLGFKFDGAGNLDTGWKPGTNGVNFTQNSAGCGVAVSDGIPVAASYEMGCSNNVDGVSQSVLINASFTDGAGRSRLNDSTTLSFTSGVPSGFVHAQRTASNATRVVKNTGTSGTGTGASSARPTVNLWIGASNGNGTPVARSTRRIAMAWAGATLNAISTIFCQAWWAYANPYRSQVAYQAILDYASGQGWTLPSTAVQAKQLQLIRDYMDNGNWEYFDVFYNFTHDGSEEFGRINWKNPGTYTLSIVGTAPTFFSKSGIAFDGSGNYNTGWIPGTNGQNLQQNEAGFAVYIPTDTQGAMFDIGTSPNADGSTAGSALNNWNTANNIPGKVNGGTTMLPAATTSIGHTHVQRTTSNAQKIFRNGTQLASDTTASSARSTVPFYIGGGNANGSPINRSTRRIGMAWIGASLINREVFLNTNWNNYLTGL